MIVEFSPAAIADANGAFNWYEDQHTGLGEEFSVELDDVLGLLAEHPQMGQVVLGETRQKALKRFP